MMLIRSIGRPLLIVALASVLYADIDDGHGKLWREVRDTVNLSWNQVAAVCPTDGVTPGSGTVGTVDFTGWTWATQAQVTELLSYWEDDILTTSTLQGAGYVLPCLFFTSTFYPTYQVHIETLSYQYVGGWTATTGGSGAAIRRSLRAMALFQWLHERRRVRRSGDRFPVPRLLALEIHLRSDPRRS